MCNPFVFVAVWCALVAALGFALTVAGLAGRWLGLARVGILIAACSALTFCVWLVLVVVIGGLG